MNTELDKIKFKIKALAAKTVSNGCSEHEAMSAMLGVGRLLSQYNLTMDECDVRESVCKTIFINIGRTKRHPIDSCITALANLVSAKCWFHRTRGKPSAYAFFGQENDLELIDYLYRVISSAIDSESEAFKSTDTYLLVGGGNGSGSGGERRSATISFQRGMAVRISKRLMQMKQDIDAELARHRVTGTALIVLKKQLVEDEFKKHGPQLRSTRSMYSVRNPQAFARGLNAGEKVNLSRPLKRDSKKPGGLLT